MRNVINTTKSVQCYLNMMSAGSADFSVLAGRLGSRPQPNLKHTSMVIVDTILHNVVSNLLCPINAHIDDHNEEQGDHARHDYAQADAQHVCLIPV